jgi:predicted signal transduction protein with EAL and GGDEF domain
MRGQDRAYRVGGDEFALIMPETAPEDAGPALDRLRRTIETGVTPMSISIGYASTNNAYSPELLRDHADKALYEAKHKGKNQVAMFSLDLSSGTELTTAKTQALRRVLDTGNLEMWYQPIYHYGGEALLAFEALLRMPAEPEIEGPEEAFKIAESLGKARELDLLCVAGALNSAYNLPTDVKLFINLDPATLTNSRFSVRELTQLVDASPFERARIVFEVTEHSIVPVLTLRD